MQKSDEKKFCESVGEKLRLIRKQTGLTQKEAAQAACLSQSALSDIESGKRSCPIYNAVKLIKLYDVSFGSVFGEAGTDSEAGPYAAPKELDNAVKLLSSLVAGSGSPELIFTCSQSMAISIYTVFRKLYRENPHNSEKLFGISYNELEKLSKGFAPERVLYELERCLRHCNVRKELLELPVEMNAELSAFIKSSERILLAANTL